MDTIARLDGRTVLVAGATGGIGEGMTRALLDAGARVVATGRHSDKLTQLGDRLAATGSADRLRALRLDLTADDRAESAALDAVGPLDGAIVAIGDWGPPGRVGLLDTDDDRWNHMIAANLTAHFHALRTLTPRLAPTGALVHLTGFSAEIPYPFAALVGATNAAKKSLVRSLTAELDGRGPRVYELVIGPIRTRARAAAGVDDPGWYSAEQLGAHAADLITGAGPHAGDPLQYLVLPRHGITTTAPSH